MHTVHGKCFKGENFCGCAQNTIFTGKLSGMVHQAEAIIYCTQQIIEGENFYNWLKTEKTANCFPPQNICCVRYRIVQNI